MAKKAATKRAASKKTASKKTAPPKTPAAKGAKTSAASAKSVSVTVDDVMQQLASLGNEKVRALNSRNGAGDKQFGVKLGDLRVVADKLKTNHELALALWKTGNADAQLLATLVIKPRELSTDQMEQMVQSANFLQVGDWLHSYVLKEHPSKEALRVKWMASDGVMTSRAAWRLTAGRVAKSPEGLDLVALLDRIESEMGSAPSEVQWTMNACLAEIGINFPKHRKRALAIGEKLGIYRDYPVSKGCTSPFAPIWITEMVKRQG